MEGKKEKVGAKEIQEVGAPTKAINISQDVPGALEQPIEVVEQETPEESDEEYPEDYEEEYSEGEYPEDYEDDEDFEAEAGGSEQAPLGGLYGLFKDVAHQKDTKRVSNLTKEELGIWNLSLRDCERIALIANTFHHPGVADFFKKQSRIISDSAMSRGGWFTELFITSKKFASRESGSSISNLPQFSKKSKWKIFSDKGSQQTQEQNE